MDDNSYPRNVRSKRILTEEQMEYFGQFCVLAPFVMGFLILVANSYIPTDEWGTVVAPWWYYRYHVNWLFYLPGVLCSVYSVPIICAAFYYRQGSVILQGLWCLFGGMILLLFAAILLCFS